ncbi:hypothetical protein BSU04_22930 [Caballeronia sordidicola]|uniref:Uncharacterized protein n=1 Tax=Caballeronia sordidicola TaxID=196367 RepID=A0A226WYJ8_CABSO|nr:hypothetical protein BSU04_22930 [Caballeronia sordidicola]
MQGPLLALTCTIKRGTVWFRNSFRFPGGLLRGQILLLAPPASLSLAVKPNRVAHADQFVGFGGRNHFPKKWAADHTGLRQPDVISLDRSTNC